LLDAALNQEMEAVMRGDYSTDESLQAQLKRAHELKVSFMRELKDHVAEHGCQRFQLSLWAHPELAFRLEPIIKL
jgi:hypothetical protein